MSYSVETKALRCPDLFDETLTVDALDILARDHRRVVDEFIGSVLDELDIGDLERNVVGVALRQEVETCGP